MSAGPSSSAPPGGRRCSCCRAAGDARRAGRRAHAGGRPPPPAARGSRRCTAPSWCRRLPRDRHRARARGRPAHGLGHALPRLPRRGALALVLLPDPLLGRLLLAQGMLLLSSCMPRCGAATATSSSGAGLGAVLAAAAALLLTRLEVSAVVPLLVGFVVLTIGAERVELARWRCRPRPATLTASPWSSRSPPWPRCSGDRRRSPAGCGPGGPHPLARPPRRRPPAGAHDGCRARRGRAAARLRLAGGRGSGLAILGSPSGSRPATTSWSTRPSRLRDVDGPGPRPGDPARGAAGPAALPRAHVGALALLHATLLVAPDRRRGRSAAGGRPLSSATSPPSCSSSSSPSSPR